MSSSLRHVARLVAVAASVALLPAMAAGGDEARGPAFGKPESLGVPMRAVMIRSGAIGVWPGGRPVAYVTSSSKDEPINFSVLDLRTGQRLAGHVITGMSSNADMTVAPDGMVYLSCARSSGAMLVRYDPKTDHVTKLGVPVAGETFMNRAVSDEDGVVYGGTYPGGNVFKYDPRKTGAAMFTDYGAIADGEFYARSIAWADGTLYVGTGTHARLFAMDPASGEKREIQMPDETRGQEFVYRVDHRNGLLFVYMSPSLDYHVYDTRAGQWIERLQRNGEGGITPVDEHGSVYFVSLEHKSLLQYNVAAQKASPVSFESGKWNYNTARVIGLARFDEPDYPDQTVVGVSQTGEIWHFNPQTAASRRVAGQPLDTAIRIRHLGVGPDGNIYIGGAFTPGLMGRYLTQQEKLEQISGPRGRVDSFHIHQDRFYFGTYTDAGVSAWDPAGQPWDYGRNPRRVFSLSDHKQERVYALASAGERLAVGGIGIKGHHDGVLGFYHADADRLDVKGAILPGHGIASLRVHDDLLIGGTSIHQIGADPVVPDAKLFLWDLKTDKLLWHGVPVPGASSIGEVILDELGHLWGLTTLGVVFEFDLETKQVLRTAKVGPEGGMWGMGTLFFAGDGTLYGSHSAGDGGVFSLDPRTLEVTHLDAGEHAVADAQGRIYYAKGAELWRITPRPGTHTSAAGDGRAGTVP